MGQTYRRVSRIDALSAVSGCTHNVDTDIFFINMDIHVLRLWHYGHGNGRGMDTSAGLCLRHSLYPVYAGLVFHHGISSLPVDHEGHVLHAADTDLLTFYQFHLPVLALCIVKIHTIDLCGEQGSFISAGACTDLYDNILLIIRVFWKQQDLQFMLQLFHSCLGSIQFFFGKLPHLFIRFFLQHLQAVFDCLLAGFIFIICLYDRRQIILFFHQSAETFLVICHIRFLQFA